MKYTTIIVFWLALSTGLGTALEAEAQDAEHRVLYSNFTAFRLNPIGIRNEFEIGYQYKLYDSDSVLFKTGHVRVYLAPTLAPALTRLGVGVDIEPLAVLKLGARWEWVQYFGTFDHFQSFKDVDQPYSDSDIATNGDLGLAEVRGGWQLTLSAELRGRVGPVVVRNKLVAMYGQMDMRAGDTVWYDPYFDILSPKEGWVLINDADVLVFLLNDKLIVGVRHNVTHAIFPDEAFGANGPRDIASTPTQRLGPLIAYRFFDEPGAAFNRPTAVLLVNWYLVHPHRTGADVSQAVPYVALGFAFSGDLL
ncbi:MAG: hypothetical protein ACI9OJ_000553 [Myxococcota bacterium]